MLLLADGRLDDGSVEGVGDQADDQVVLGNLSVESLLEYQRVYRLLYALIGTMLVGSVLLDW